MMANVNYSRQHMPMQTIYLGLGSNLGDRAANLRQARERLAVQVTEVRASAVYATAPAYVVDQPPFLNMALEGRTALPPAELLVFLKGVEQAMGRVPTRRYGPRLIDLDILLYADRVVQTPDLVIPHPLMAERAFVLLPLAEIAPALRHPTLGRTIADLAAPFVATPDVVRLRPEV